MRPKAARPRLERTARTVAAWPAVIGTIVWTHALAGALGHAPEGAVALTAAAVATALVGVLAYASARRAALAAVAAALVSAGFVGLGYPGAALPALALVPAGAAFAAAGAWLARRVPATLAERAARRRAISLLWLVAATAAVVQVGRLATYMTQRESDWFLSTRHPFYAKHECMSAYVYAAELDRRGEENVYDASHYPGLVPGTEARTELRGLSPEDPYQYPPQFLLLPRLAIALTDDYQAIRMVWFGLNVTLCMGALLAIAAWVGDRVGAATALLSPLVLLSFPVLYDFQYGQFHFAAVALAMLGFVAFSRGRPALGGTLLAVAVLAKMFPVFLLVPLAVRRRWRELVWTAAAGAALTALAFVVLGTAPFHAFVDYQIPRLTDGTAFAFGEAWPDLAHLVVLGNQGIQGIVHKLAALDVPGTRAGLARAAGSSYALVLLAFGVLAGLRADRATRGERVVLWLGLLGMASLASAGVWADYVPLTCVWLLTAAAPLVRGRRGVQLALAVCAVLQATLLGAVPLGSIESAAWMLPLSLLSALAMLTTFAGAVTLRVARAPQAR